MRLWGMYQHGWAIARPKSHAMIFWTDAGTWSDEPLLARRYDQLGVAARHAHRIGGTSILDMLTVQHWVASPRMKMSRPRPLARR
jgi:hypothetical protein